MKKLASIIILFLLGACTAANQYTHIEPTEARMVQDCEYLETYAENADPGRLLPKYRFSDAEQTVLHRADRIGATHIVWIYNFPRMGSAAEVYRCDD
jgi:hypothetical protein